MQPNESITQYQPSKPIVIPRQFGYEIVQDGKRYYLTPEQYAQVAALVQPQPAPIHIYHQPTVDPHADRDRFWMRFATGFAIVGSGIAIAALVKAVFFPAPIPTASQPPVQPVVVIPPSPQPQPYTQIECKEAGFLGLNQVCTTEKGYR